MDEKEEGLKHSKNKSRTVISGSESKVVIVLSLWLILAACYTLILLHKNQINWIKFISPKIDTISFGSMFITVRDTYFNLNTNHRAASIIEMVTNSGYTEENAP